MAGLFESTGGGGATIALDEWEASILRSLEVQLLELIGPGPGGGDGDPLAALFAEGPTEAPADPVLARFFPDAYGDPEKPDDDDEAAASSGEFRRFTELDLRARKRDDALFVVRALDGLGGDGVLKLGTPDCPRWLGALNDLRLALGVRLEVTEDDEEGLYELPDSDERKPLVMAYLWLGALQESLLEAMVD
ncbi:DUF2017 domain-containing protein [Kitasatospora sp. NPDC059599]|uniref:DUF2017 domain-containing protein n=1 Tax=Kitasatospora sp. NPDC059599 TaxID=3346880 RepID=UPI0036BBCF5E